MARAIFFGQTGRGEPLDADCLFHSFISYAPVDHPEIAQLPLAEWECFADDCSVREVTLQFQLIRSDVAFSALRCPGCGGALRFNGYLQAVSIVKADDGIAEAFEQVASRGLLKTTESQK